MERQRMRDEESQSSYKELVVWQKSMAFANDVIDLVDRLETDRKHYRLIEQLEAAVTSIPILRKAKVETRRKNTYTSCTLPAVLFTKPLHSWKSFTCRLG